MYADLVDDEEVLASRKRRAPVRSPYLRDDECHAYADRRGTRAARCSCCTSRAEAAEAHPHGVQP